MFRRRALPGVIAALGLVLAGSAAPAHAAEPAAPAHADAAHATTAHAVVDSGTEQGPDFSVATVDTGLTSTHEGKTLTRLQTGHDKRAEQLAKTIAKTKPDVLVLTGLDVDSDGATLDVLRDRYLNSTHGSPSYKYVYAPQGNAGVDSGADLDGDGTIGGPGDALGPGAFPGQDSMAVLSVHPIDTTGARSFSDLKWRDVPGNHLAQASYPADARRDLPLFSTDLWDVPVDMGSGTVHVVAASLSHTEGPRSNAVRNRDQLSFLRDYVDGSAALGKLVDDQGHSGPLSADSPAVVAGDLGVDSSHSGPGAKTVASLLERHRNRQAISPAPQTGWLGRLDDLLKNGTKATRSDADGVPARLDYVIAAGGGLSVTRSTASVAVMNQDFSSRMVVSDFDF